jgi:hypothetical protein
LRAARWADPSPGSQRRVPANERGRLGLLVAVHGREDGAVHTVGEHRSLARGEADHVLGLLDGEVHGGADGQPVVVGGQPVHHLDRGVFDHVGDDLAGDLLGDDEPLTVGADLGEQAGEQLDRVGAGGVAVDAA